MDILVGTVLLCFLLGFSFAVLAVESMHKERDALRARVAELEQAAEGARLELVENDEDSRENAIAVLRAALAGKEGE